MDSESDMAAFLAVPEERAAFFKNKEKSVYSVFCAIDHKSQHNLCDHSMAYVFYRQVLRFCAGVGTPC